MNFKIQVMRAWLRTTHGGPNNIVKQRISENTDTL